MRHEEQRSYHVQPCHDIASKCAGLEPCPAEIVSRSDAQPATPGESGLRVRRDLPALRRRTARPIVRQIMS